MPTGRYAPSPTGTLHLGNLRTAVAAWLFARSSGSPFVLRWEDLDQTAAAHHEASQLADLTALGIEFDGPPVRQTSRRDHYRDVVADLSGQGLVYRCWCSRREIREAAVAPHGTPGSYPGTCRGLSSAKITEHEQTGRPPALRLRTEGDLVTVTDTLHGPTEAHMDDIVLQRGDGTPAYNLVVVVDDELQAVGEVVRGDDLLSSTPRHAYLQRLLGLREPVWTHVPLVLDTAGDRLAKRDGSAGLETWMSAGGSIRELLSAFGETLGVPAESNTSLAEMEKVFSPTSVPLAAAIFDPSGPRLSLDR